MLKLPMPSLPRPFGLSSRGIGPGKSGRIKVDWSCVKPIKAMSGLTRSNQPAPCDYGEITDIPSKGPFLARLATFGPTSLLSLRFRWPPRHIEEIGKVQNRSTKIGSGRLPESRSKNTVTFGQFYYLAAKDAI